jgi:hypothetical protein
MRNLRFFMWPVLMSKQLKKKQLCSINLYKIPKSKQFPPEEPVQCTPRFCQMKQHTSRPVDRFSSFVKHFKLEDLSPVLHSVQSQQHNQDADSNYSSLCTVKEAN